MKRSILIIFGILAALIFAVSCSDEITTDSASYFDSSLPSWLANATWIHSKDTGVDTITVTITTDDEEIYGLHEVNDGYKITGGLKAWLEGIIFSITSTDSEYFILAYDDEGKFSYRFTKINDSTMKLFVIEGSEVYHVLNGIYHKVEVNIETVTV